MRSGGRLTIAEVSAMISFIGSKPSTKKHANADLELTILSLSLPCPPDIKPDISGGGN